MMTLPSAKEIARLAKACRAAGITTFKGGGIEFTLSDFLPQKPQKKSAPDTAAPVSGNIENDSPGYDDLLFWSVPLPDQEQKADS